MHTSAPLALAEAGEFLLKSLGALNNVLLAVRQVEAKFRKPAFGKATSKVKKPIEQVFVSRQEMSDKGRSFLRIEVNIYDQQQALTLNA